jgi:hypothetical protein
MLQGKWNVRSDCTAPDGAHETQWYSGTLRPEAVNRVSPHN